MADFHHLVEGRRKCHVENFLKRRYRLSEYQYQLQHRGSMHNAGVVLGPPRGVLFATSAPTEPEVSREGSDHQQHHENDCASVDHGLLFFSRAGFAFPSAGGPITFNAVRTPRPPVALSAEALCLVAADARVSVLAGEDLV